MNAKEYYERSEQAMQNVYHKQYTTPQIGHFYSTKATGHNNVPVIYAREEKGWKNMQDYFFYRIRNCDEYIHLFRDEFFRPTLKVKNILQDYLLREYALHITEHPEDAEWLGSRDRMKIDKEDTDSQMRLRAIVDTLYMPIVNSSTDVADILHAIINARDKTCKAHALNKHPYSWVGFGYLSKEDDLKYKQRIKKAVDELVKSFEDIKDSYKPHFDID